MNGEQEARPRADIPAAQSDEVVVLLRRIIRAIDLQSKRLSREFGLTTPQMVILQAVRDLGEVTTGRLSDAVSLSQATVTTILDRLEDRGLIERYRSRIDRRVVHSRLTDAGRAVLGSAPPLLHDRFRDSFARLSPRRQREILGALRAVAEMMGADNVVPAPLLDMPTTAQGSPGGGAAL